VSRRIRRRRAWLLLLVWIALTVTVLSVPLPKPPRILERGLDKVLHTALFSIMGVLGQSAAPWVSLALTATIAFGVEWIQRCIPARHYDPIDWAANFVGLIVGMMACELATRLNR